MILGLEDDTCEAEPAIIPNFIGNEHHRWAWYFLLPLTVPVDVVTFPIQLLVCATGACS